MKQLNLPIFEFALKETNGKTYIFDEIRKRYLMLTPEEWVRQNFVKFLVSHKGFPASLIALEMPFKLNNSDKRSDIVVYNKNGKIVLLVECKASEINISQKVFDQAASYNLKLNAEFLIITNGIAHYCCKLDYKVKKWLFMDEIPYFSELESLIID